MLPPAIGFLSYEPKYQSRASKGASGSFGCLPALCAFAVAATSGCLHDEDIPDPHFAAIVAVKVFDCAVFAPDRVFTGQTGGTAIHAKGACLTVRGQDRDRHRRQEFERADDAVPAHMRPLAPRSMPDQEFPHP